MQVLNYVCLDNIYDDFLSPKLTYLRILMFVFFVCFVLVILLLFRHFYSLDVS